MTIQRTPNAVLFDLDGTLADTAPDLIGALQRLRDELGLPARETGRLRDFASRGAPAILEAGLPELDAVERESLRERYLDVYAAHCWRDSRPFDGMPALLDALEHAGISWGVVTNKIERLARLVVEQAGWAGRAGCLVAGDTAARPKPAPDPVLAACRMLAVAPERTVFVGDDERDVAAGRAAGTRTVAALWGYIPEPERVVDWGADAVAEAPGDLPRLLRVAAPGAAV
jgi:phosphoglycolate phosphatase